MSLPDLGSWRQGPPWAAARIDAHRDRASGAYEGSKFIAAGGRFAKRFARCARSRTYDQVGIRGGADGICGSSRL
ncbi:MAG: hypothetical protein R3D67_02045 [Hyphomicrobiaceae bacterium]